MKTVGRILLIVAACMAVLGPSVSLVLAQENPPAAPADPAPAAPAEAHVGGEQVMESWISWFIRCSGLIGLFILILLIYFIATCVQLFIEFRAEAAMPPEVVAGTEDLLQRRDYKGVYDFLQANECLYGRVLMVGIGELPNGLAEAKETMERAGECEQARMEKKISMLAVLGTLGPMIGLIGTLKGMISSFSEIARSAGAQIKAEKVAEGISEALLLTFEGVFLSIPAIFFFAIFRNRISTIMNDTMFSADQFLRKFAHAARVKAGVSGPGAGPAQAGMPPMGAMPPGAMPQQPPRPM